MKQKNLYFYTNLLAWGLVLLLIGNYVFGWTTPTATPPSSNLPAPINVSSTAQSKEGYLAIATSTAPSYPLDVIGTGRFTGNITSLGFFYSSDENLKENIQKIETPLAKIMKLDGISFNWKDSGKKSIGLIAQDVEKVFPEIVGTEEGTGLKSIEYGKLVAPLIEAVKEQQKMIDEQKELIDKQGEEIKALKVLLGQF